jgi:HEAT repeat protein
MEATPQPHVVPPLEPPSARVIVRLFVWPAVIVVVIVAVMLLFGRLARSELDPTRLLQELGSGNEHVRWRAAHRLAVGLAADPALAARPDLAAALVAHLAATLDQPEFDRSTACFLAAALGSLTTSSTPGPDVEAALLRALEPGRPLELRAAALESVARRAARAPATDPRILKVLDTLSREPTPTALRERAAFALDFCREEAATRLLVAQAEGDPGLFVRFQAATALARRGDPAALPTLRILLDTPALRASLHEQQAGSGDRAGLLQRQAITALIQGLAPAQRAAFLTLRTPLELLSRSKDTPTALAASDALHALTAP